MSKIDQIIKAIEDAANGISKMDGASIDIPGFTSHGLKHLMNNLGAISTKYCEVGIHKASLFVATLFQNDLTGIAIDNYSEFDQGGQSRELAYKHCGQFLKPEQWEIIEKDCWTITPKEVKDVDLYLYDGAHDQESQRKGISHFKDMLADECIVCVDDYRWQHVKMGTMAGIKEAGFEILYDQYLWDGKEDGSFWNGYAIFLLKKSK